MGSLLLNKGTISSMAASGWPFGVPPLYEVSGPVMGLEARSNLPLGLNPWEWKRRGYIEAPIITIVGEKGRGKSSIAKSWGARARGRMARNPDGTVAEISVRWHDNKALIGGSEYHNLSEWFGGFPLSIAEEASINLFDPAMGMTELSMIETAISVLEVVSGTKPMRSDERLALVVAVLKMARMCRDPRDKNKMHLTNPELLQEILYTQDFSDLEEYQAALREKFDNQYADELEENEWLKERLDSLRGRESNTSPMEFRQASSRVYQYCSLLYEEYGVVFGGKNSLREVLSHPWLKVDWTGVEQKSRTLVEMMIWKWQGLAQKRGDVSLLPNFDIGDEWFTFLNNEMAMRSLDENVRTARSRPTTVIRITQLIVDPASAGDEGSALRKLGEAIDMGTEVWIIGRQPDKPYIRRAIHDLGFSLSDTDFIVRRLQRGQFAVKMKDFPPFFILHDLTPKMRELVRTDDATDLMEPF